MLGDSDTGISNLQGSGTGWTWYSISTESDPDVVDSTQLVLDIALPETFAVTSTSVSIRPRPYLAARRLTPRSPPFELNR